MRGCAPRSRPNQARPVAAVAPNFFSPQGKQKAPRPARLPPGYVSMPARPVPRRGMRALRRGGAPHADGEGARRCSERSGAGRRCPRADGPARGRCARPAPREPQRPLAAAARRAERRPRERRGGRGDGGGRNSARPDPQAAGTSPALRAPPRGAPAARQPAMSEPGNRSSLRTGLRRARGADARRHRLFTRNTTSGIFRRFSARSHPLRLEEEFGTTHPLCVLWEARPVLTHGKRAKLRQRRSIKPPRLCARTQLFPSQEEAGCSQSPRFSRPAPLPGSCTAPAGNAASKGSLSNCLSICALESLCS